MKRGLSVVVVAIALLAGACDKTTDSQPAASKSVGAKSDPRPAPPPFCIFALRIEDDVHKIAPWDSEQLRRDIIEMLGSGQPEVHFGAAIKASEQAESTLQRCAKPVSAAANVGVLVRVTAALSDAKGEVISPQQVDSSAELAVSVALHVERGGDNQRPEIGVSDMTAAVPFPRRNRAHAAKFVRVRLSRALSLAAADAFGQLVVRHRSDSDVLQMLSDDKVWRRIAALREVGERGLVKGIETVEKAALDSRKDVALIAISTLGRLSERRALPVLSKALDARAPQVLDAALTAIADIGGAEAKTMIRAIAKEHRSPWIRRRAQYLLEHPTMPGK